MNEPGKNGKRFYLDTSALLCALGVDCGRETAKQIEKYVDEMRKQRGAGRIGVISALARLEAVGAVWFKQLSRNRGSYGPDDKARFLQQVFAYLQNIDPNPISQKELKSVGISASLLESAMNLLIASKEFDRWVTRCKNCNNDVPIPTTGHDNRYKTIGGVDSIHLALASEMGAEVLITSDEGFRGAHAPLKITVFTERGPHFVEPATPLQ